MSYLCYIYIIIYRGKTKASRREGQRLDGLPSCQPRPRPPPSPLSGDNGNAEQKTKKKGRNRENQGEEFRRHLHPLLASLLLRLMPSPSTPSQAAHHFEGRAATSSASGRCYRHHIATPRRRSTSSRAAPRRYDILTASSPSSFSSFMW